MGPTCTSLTANRFRRNKKLINPHYSPLSNSSIMKNWFVILFFYLSAGAFAQDKVSTIPLPADMTVHFLSPEPIQYVDISSKELVGDLALPNLLRIKLRDTLCHFSRAIVTIAGQRFIKQYLLTPGNSLQSLTVDIDPLETRPLDISGIGLSQNQLRQLALNVISVKPKHPIEKTSAFGVDARVNQVYTVGDHIFLDLSYRNRTRLIYNIDGIRFRIEDKKVTKATNVQTVELKPLFVLQDIGAFRSAYRNIFVFKKISFPGNKILNIELSEKQLSGRIINARIKYQDVLDADTIPN